MRRRPRPVERRGFDAAGLEGIVVDDRDMRYHITFRNEPAGRLTIRGIAARTLASPRLRSPYVAIARARISPDRRLCERVLKQEKVRGKRGTASRRDERPRRASRLGSFRSLPRHGCAGGEARPRSRRGDERGVRGALQGQAQGDRGSGRRRRQARRGDRRIRADRGDPRPARQLCRPRLFRRHLRSGAREVLRRPAGPADHDLDASPVLRAGAQPARRRGARRRRSKRRRSPSTGRGSRIFGWSGPTSSKIGSSSSSTRNR